MRTLFLCLLCAYAAALTASVSYIVEDVNLGGGVQFQFVLFNVTLNVDPYINGTATSALPLTQTTIDGRTSISSLVSQLNATTMKCPCTAPECLGFSQCDGTKCTFTTDFNDNTAAEGPPTILLPLPPVEDTLYVVFSVFAGRNATDLNVNKFPKTLMFGKALRNFDVTTGSWVQYVPLSVNLSTCTFEILGNTSSTYYTDVNGTALGDVTIGGNNMPLTRVCNYSALINKSDGLLDAINSLSSAVNRADLETSTWLVASFLARDAWLGCEQMARGLFTYGDVTAVVNTGGACLVDASDPSWATDPCCNLMLSFTQCCVARNVLITQTVINGTDDALVESRCNTPSSIEIVLNQLSTNLFQANLCVNQLYRRGNYIEAWDAISSFSQTCLLQVFGSAGSPPPCKTDADCWTKCDLSKQQCIIPFGNSEKYLVDCFIATMNPELQRYLRNEWGLVASSPNNQFAAAMALHLSTAMCEGPTAYQFNGNNTACINDVACNWDVSVDQSTCLAAPAQYCGDCHGNLCLSHTLLPYCAQWAPAGENCSGLFNATEDSTAPNQCIISTSFNESTCINADLCPPLAQDIRNRRERICGPLCYLDSVTNSTDCAAAAVGGVNTTWSNNTESGAFVCFITDAPTLADCTGFGGNWTYGTIFREGVLNTQSKCAAGACTHGDWIAPANCTANSFCSVPCAVCEHAPGYIDRICYANTTNVTYCSQLGGIMQYNMCSFPWMASNETLCESFNYTFESCVALTANIQSCRNCDPNSGIGCNLHVLKCMVNNAGECTNSFQCALSGQCDDWELQNWDTAFCQSNNTAPNCTAACIVAFDLDWVGNPICPTGTDMSRLGCIYRNITSQAGCQAFGGSWTPRATSEAECNAHGFGCFNKRFLEPTRQGSTACTQCGGTIGYLYTWTNGTWASGTTYNLTWTNTTWGIINELDLAIDGTVLNTAMEAVAATMVSKAVKSAYLCQYNLIASNLKTISCDCGDVEGTDCFTNGVLFAQIAETTIFSGFNVTNEWGGSSISVLSNSVNTNTDAVTVTVYAVTDYSGLANGSLVLGSHGRLGFTPPSIYEVVLTTQGVIWGQIIGSGVVITASDDVNGWQQCMTVDSTIAIDPAYTVYDFGLARNNDLTNVMALNISAGIVFHSLCGTIGAGIVSGTTTIFPIKREATAPAGGATAATTATTTTTTTTTTTGGSTTTTTTEASTTTDASTTTTTTTTAASNSTAPPLTDKDTNMIIGLTAGMGGFMALIGIGIIYSITGQTKIASRKRR